MPIISSVIVLNRPNGSEFDRRIREIHTDHLGGETVFNYNVLLNASGNVVNSDGVILFNTLADKTAANAVKALTQLEDSEAEQASETDNEIVAGDYADIALVALKYLRKAYALDDPYEAYKKFDRFNNYRVAQGWSLTQVVTNLSPVGLTQGEWDSMLTRYTYLSNAQRVTAMENYQLVLNGDPRG